MFLKNRQVSFRVDRDIVSKQEFERIVKNISEYSVPEVFMSIDGISDTDYITYNLNWQSSLWDETDGERIKI